VATSSSPWEWAWEGNEDVAAPFDAGPCQTALRRPGVPGSQSPVSGLAGKTWNSPTGRRLPQAPPVSEPEKAKPGFIERIRGFVGAWQPLTGTGLAAFGQASLGRLVAFQFVAATGIGLLLVVSLRLCWFPVIEQGLTQLPDSAPLGAGSLQWPGTNAVRLAENPWLGLVVRPAEPLPEDAPGQTADLQLELRPRSLRLEGVFGHVERSYPPVWNLDLGRIPATATWNAWKRPISILVGIGAALFLLASWWSLATAYLIPAWIFARITGRALGAGAVWKMAGAALLVGAAVGAGGLGAYACGMVRLPGILVSQLLHIPAGWIWLAWGILASDSRPAGKLPAKPASKATKPNPFAR